MAQTQTLTEGGGARKETEVSSNEVKRQIFRKKALCESDIAPGLMEKTRASLILLWDSERSSGKRRNQICLIGLTD